MRTRCEHIPNKPDTLQSVCTTCQEPIVPAKPHSDTWVLLNPVFTPLPGHTTQETAYLVDDYPYGFRLRCKIRYWLEFKAGHGFRLVSQTTNPKRSGEVWNKPKASTYTLMGVMGLDDQNHVTWTGLSLYDDGARVAQFEVEYGHSFDDNQQKAIAYLQLIARKRAERGL